jgi:class 3 adenylate cyclase
MTEHGREPLAYTPQHLAEKILTSRSALEGERKHVPVLFCDLAHSTPIAERLGPERMHTLLNRFFELALEALHGCEGTINQFLGDGFMALFGAPSAHEDHARRGVLAALAHAQGYQDTVTTHLSTAHAWFRKPQVPTWVEKTAQLARKYSVTLTEGEMHGLTEDSS